MTVWTQQKFRGLSFGAEGKPSRLRNLPAPKQPLKVFSRRAGQLSIPEDFAPSIAPYAAGTVIHDVPIRLQRQVPQPGASPQCTAVTIAYGHCCCMPTIQQYANQKRLGEKPARAPPRWGGTLGWFFAKLLHYAVYPRKHGSQVGIPLEDGVSEGEPREITKRTGPEVPDLLLSPPVKRRSIRYPKRID